MLQSFIALLDLFSDIKFLPAAKVLSDAALLAGIANILQLEKGEEILFYANPTTAKY